MRSTVRRGLSALVALALVAGSALVGSSAQASAGGWITTPTDGQTVGTGALHVTGVLPLVFDNSFWWVDSGAPTTISAAPSVDPLPFDFTVSGLAPGEHRIFVSQGPAQSPDFVDIVVDPPPSIVITNPTTTLQVVIGQPLTIAATITDTNFASWTISVDSSFALSGTDANLAEQLGTTGWAFGVHTVTLTVTDTYGSPSVASFTVIIEIPIPPPPPPPNTPPIIPNTPLPPPPNNPPPTDPNAPTNPNPTPTTTPNPTPTPTPTPSAPSKPASTLAAPDETEAPAALPTSELTAEPTAELADDPASEPTNVVEAADPGDGGIPPGWIFGGIGLILAIALGLLIRSLIARRP